MGNKRKIRVVTDLKGNPRLEYVLNFLNNHPAFNDWLWTTEDVSYDTIVWYGSNQKHDEEGWIITCQTPILQKENNNSDIEWHLNPYIHDGKTYYGIADCQLAENSFVSGNIFNIDIFSTIFYIVSRFEEVFAGQDDQSQAGWLNESQHQLIKKNLNETPIIDHLCFIFSEIIHKNQNHEITSPYSISHDIDVLYRFKPFSNFLKSILATIWYRRGWHHLSEIILYYQKMLKGKNSDPYDCFSWLLREENLWKEKFLFLMSGGNSKYDNKYNISHPLLNEIIQKARKNNYLIGIHPSYNAYDNIVMLNEEIQKLQNKIGENVAISRQHWLRWSWVSTPYIIENVGIKIDSSMGYNNHLGFRCGTGFPYRMYDFSNEKAFSFTEYPFAYMESSAIHLARNTGNDIIKISKAFIQNNKYNTHLLFNFHNSNFDPTTPIGKKLLDFYRNELTRLLEE